MNHRRALLSFLALLATILLVTLLILSSVSYFLAIDPAAYILDQDVPENTSPVTLNLTQERIPRIIHQTWKTDVLPPRWSGISKACRTMMPDYEYMLWTDASSREFIAAHYPWFIDTFDNYRYPIQRADAIRYFVLYHYGGIYMDLDIGCRRSMDPLLVYPAILPKTIPVGISNDLMFAEKAHPFFKQTIDNLNSFDYSWLINYPTVMFSTGPMFLSIQYGLYVREHFDMPVSPIRVLPKSLYGKNIDPSEAPHSFFSHFYASSWHDDDAPFIAFLSSWGKLMMWLGLIIFIIGIFRLFSKPRRSITRIAGYDILLPRLSQSGRGRHFHLGRFVFSFSQHSPDSMGPDSPTGDLPILHIPLDHAGRPSSFVMGTCRRVRNRIRMIGERLSPPSSPGVLFFLPIATHSPDIELERANRPTRAASSLGQRLQSEKEVESGLMQSSGNGLDWDNMDDQTSHSRSSSDETAVDDELEDWYTA